MPVQVDVRLEHEVWIPISPTQFESAEWVGTKADAMLDMMAWCDSHKLTRGRDYDYQFIKCLYDGIHTHVFYFANPSNAVLFKLTFGGVKPIVRSRSPGIE